MSKNTELKVRLSEKQKEKLKADAKESNQKVSKYVRSKLNLENEK